jgi:hypothetical protein
MQYREGGGGLIPELVGEQVLTQIAEMLPPT